MRARVVLSPRALQQAEIAARWWVRNCELAPTLFSEEFSSTLRLLANTPEAGVAFPKARRPDVRRILMQRTQYHLYYVHLEHEAVVRVLVVWSTARGKTPSL